ncbi:MAG: oligosaccharide flippase family protein [Candidatus Magasanikbacteria bacterium]|nr:oligosaccharide flippase family protein [Candidatus Magasanikbacteria bacterium]
MKIQTRLKTLFSYLDRILKIDSTYLAKGSFWLAVGQTSSALAGLFLAIIFANFLPKETYGTYKYVLSVISILTITTLPGIATTLAQAVAEGKEGSFIPSLYVRIKYGVVGALAAIGVAVFYYVWKNDHVVSFAFIIAALFLPFMDPVGMYGMFLHSKKEFKQSAIYFIKSQSTVLLIMVTAALLTKNILVILLSYFVTWTVTRFICLRQTLKVFPPNTIESPHVIPYGFHISLLNVIGQIAESVDSLLLFNFIGPAQVAIYAISVSPTEQIRSLFKNIPTVSIPKLAKRTVAEINAVLWKRMLYLFGIGTALSAIFVIVMPFLFTIVYHKYSEGIHFAQWYAPTLALRLPLSFLSAVTQAKLTQFKKKWLYFGTIPNIILIGSLIIFTPLYGIVGILICRYINLFLTFGAGIMQWILLSKQSQRQLI